MNDLFASLLWGHIAGDYLFQNKYIALNKSERTLRGFLICVLHCAIYTLSIYAFLPNLPFQFYLYVFLTHFMIDRFSLAQKWLDLIHGRNVIEDYESKDKYREIAISFACIVYCVVDNGAHMMIQYYLAKWIGS
jgi:hypothetical protein